MTNISVTDTSQTLKGVAKVFAISTMLASGILVPMEIRDYYKKSVAKEEQQQRHDKIVNAFEQDIVATLRKDGLEKAKLELSNHNPEINSSDVRRLTDILNQTNNQILKTIKTEQEMKEKEAYLIENKKAATALIKQFDSSLEAQAKSSSPNFKEGDEIISQLTEKKMISEEELKTYTDKLSNLKFSNFSVIVNKILLEKNYDAAQQILTESINYVKINPKGARELTAKVNEMLRMRPLEELREQIKKEDVLKTQEAYQIALKKTPEYTNQINKEWENFTKQKVIDYQKSFSQLLSEKKALEAQEVVNKMKALNINPTVVRDFEAQIASYSSDTLEKKINTTFGKERLVAAQTYIAWYPKGNAINFAIEKYLTERIASFADEFNQIIILSNLNNSINTLKKDFGEYSNKGIDLDIDSLKVALDSTAKAYEIQLDKIVANKTPTSLPANMRMQPLKPSIIIYAAEVKKNISTLPRLLDGYK